MLLVCALVVTSARSQTLTPLLVHGPRTNRINVVVLSEGYTAPQLSQFLRDATNVVETLLTASPYAEYRQHFNAYAISVASAESGSDHPTTGGPFRNTYFNSAYEFYDYVITIPPNGLDPNPANGQGRVEHLINTWLPEADIVILLVNDIQPGGSSGVGGPACGEAILLMAANVDGMTAGASAGSPASSGNQGGT
ncbi:MAG: M64 family metallo-endopeptidase, partial [Limisphaera sp.]|nr:M64 family metallo-endopeptidase [Limisphaera sp.]